MKLLTNNSKYSIFNNKHIIRDDLIIKKPIPMTNIVVLEELYMVIRYTTLFLETYNKNPKVCLNCESPILFKTGDKLHKFKTRKFCSLNCSRENASKNKKNHACYSCGNKRDKRQDLDRIKSDGKDDSQRICAAGTCEMKKYYVR